MPVVMDQPRRLNDGRLAAHLLSDLPGHAGGIELIAVAVVLGCHPFAIQYPGTPKEHFDLIGSVRIDAALTHPQIATVPRRQIALILRAKRAVLQSAAPVSFPN